MCCALRLAGDQLLVYLASCPKTAGIDSSTPATLVRINPTEEWMDGWIKVLEQHAWVELIFFFFFLGHQRETVSQFDHSGHR